MITAEEARAKAKKNSEPKRLQYLEEAKQDCLNWIMEAVNDGQFNTIYKCNDAHPYRNIAKELAEYLEGLGYNVKYSRWFPAVETVFVTVSW